MTEDQAKREIAAVLAKLEAARGAPVLSISIGCTDVTGMNDKNRRYARDITFLFDDPVTYLPFA